MREPRRGGGGRREVRRKGGRGSRSGRGAGGMRSAPGWGRLGVVVQGGVPTGGARGGLQVGGGKEPEKQGEMLRQGQGCWVKGGWGGPAERRAKAVN